MEYVNKFKYENKALTIVKDSDNNVWFNMHQLGVIFEYKNLKQIVKEFVNTKHINLNHIKYFRNIVKDYKLYPKTPPKIFYIHHTGLCTLVIEGKKSNAEKVKFLIWLTQMVSPLINSNKMDTILTNINTNADTKTNVDTKTKTKADTKTNADTKINTKTMESDMPSINYKKKEIVNIIVI
jgi:prophage antirepressor-like protein